MPNIIFATDFSPIAQHAATYAIHLAKYLKMDLFLVHVYMVPFNYADSSVPLLNAAELEEISENSIKAETTRLHVLEPDIHIINKIMQGDLIDCLREEINDINTSLLILGSSGERTDSIMWGSTAVKALRSFKIPVLTIPSKAEWHTIQRITFAADYSKISPETPFSEINEWVNNMTAQLSVVHIDNPSNAIVSPPELLKKSLLPQPVSYHSVSTEDIISGVQDFVHQNKTDWLVLIPRKYGFWGSLFHKSRTKMLAQVSHIPILALHQD